MVANTVPFPAPGHRPRPLSRPRPRRPLSRAALSRAALTRGGALGQRERWIGLGFAAGGVMMVPWMFVLARTLPSTTQVSNWSMAWVGLDVLIGAGLLGTGVLLARRDPRHGLPAAATGALLAMDAWFDVLTSAPGAERALAVAMAAGLELPLACACAVLAVRSLSPTPAPAQPTESDNHQMPVQPPASGQDRPKPVPPNGTDGNRSVPAPPAGASQDHPKPVPPNRTDDNRSALTSPAGANREHPKPVPISGTDDNRSVAAQPAAADQDRPKPVLPNGTDDKRSAPGQHAATGNARPTSLPPARPGGEHPAAFRWEGLSGGVRGERVAGEGGAPSGHQGRGGVRECAEGAGGAIADGAKGSDLGGYGGGTGAEDANDGAMKDRWQSIDGSTPDG
ncbi:hypothetical protein amrb99_39680 [Actinomadura sp. RB99]|uniref:hypothetical protein n=1 Tax=Actinomadura sp. RB99 TaxID=2691577 RepID=UPI00168473EA|nr:hypothetical protein [Actinomadura sp. RB99]MBD2895036.1 hypothetical protein [Actinomadura sp. RB99]